MSALGTPLAMTCCCGAHMTYSSIYTPHVTREREAFNEAHAICRAARASRPDPTTRASRAGGRGASK